MDGTKNLSYDEKHFNCICKCFEMLKLALNAILRQNLSHKFAENKQNLEIFLECNINLKHSLSNPNLYFCGLKSHTFIKIK